MTRTFMNCESLTGNIATAADILWDDSSKSWTSINDTFFGCFNISNVNPDW